MQMPGMPCPVSVKHCRQKMMNIVAKMIDIVVKNIFIIHYIQMRFLIFAA